MPHLDGDPELSVDGARRLGKDGQMRGSTTASNSSTTSMEEGQPDVVFLCNLSQPLLQNMSTVIPPSRARKVSSSNDRPVYGSAGKSGQKVYIACLEISIVNAHMGTM